MDPSLSFSIWGSVRLVLRFVCGELLEELKYLSCPGTSLQQHRCAVQMRSTVRASSSPLLGLGFGQLNFDDEVKVPAPKCTFSLPDWKYALRLPIHLLTACPGKCGEEREDYFRTHRVQGRRRAGWDARSS